MSFLAAFRGGAAAATDDSLQRWRQLWLQEEQLDLQRNELEQRRLDADRTYQLSRDRHEQDVGEFNWRQELESMQQAQAEGEFESRLMNEFFVGVRTDWPEMSSSERLAVLDSFDSSPLAGTEIGQLHQALLHAQISDSMSPRQAKDFLFTFFNADYADAFPRFALNEALRVLKDVIPPEEYKELQRDVAHWQEVMEGQREEMIGVDRWLHEFQITERETDVIETRARANHISTQTDALLQEMDHASRAFQQVMEHQELINQGLRIANEAASIEVASLPEQLQQQIEMAGIQIEEGRIRLDSLPDFIATELRAAGIEVEKASLRLEALPQEIALGLRGMAAQVEAGEIELEILVSTMGDIVEQMHIQTGREREALRFELATAVTRQGIMEGELASVQAGVSLMYAQEDQIREDIVLTQVRAEAERQGITLSRELAEATVALDQARTEATRAGVGLTKAQVDAIFKDMELTDANIRAIFTGMGLTEAQTEAVIAGMDLTDAQAEAARAAAEASRAGVGLTKAQIDAIFKDMELTDANIRAIFTGMRLTDAQVEAVIAGMDLTDAQAEAARAGAEASRAGVGLTEAQVKAIFKDMELTDANIQAIFTGMRLTESQTEAVIAGMDLTDAQAEAARAAAKASRASVELSQWQATSERIEMITEIARTGNLEMLDTLGLELLTPIIGEEAAKAAIDTIHNRTLTVRDRYDRAQITELTLAEIQTRVAQDTAADVVQQSRIATSRAQEDLNTAIVDREIREFERDHWIETWENRRDLDWYRAHTDRIQADAYARSVDNTIATQQQVGIPAGVDVREAHNNSRLAVGSSITDIVESVGDWGNLLAEYEYIRTLDDTQAIVEVSRLADQYGFSAESVDAGLRWLENRADIIYSSILRKATAYDAMMMAQGHPPMWIEYGLDITREADNQLWMDIVSRRSGEQIDFLTREGSFAEVGAILTPYLVKTVPDLYGDPLADGSLGVYYDYLLTELGDSADEILTAAGIDEPADLIPWVDAEREEYRTAREAAEYGLHYLSLHGHEVDFDSQESITRASMLVDRKLDTVVELIEALPNTVDFTRAGLGVSETQLQMNEARIQQLENLFRMSREDMVNSGMLYLAGSEGMVGDIQSWFGMERPYGINQDVVMSLVMELGTNLTEAANGLNILRTRYVRD